jgi:Spy/CpxP family protein refolding chaperone
MTGVLAATMVLAVAGTLLAKPFFGHGPSVHGMGAGVDGLKALLELKLSQDQQAQLLSLLGHFEDQRDALRSSLRETRRDVAGVLRATPFNEETARKAFQNASAVRVELWILRAKLMSEIKSILTPEQLQLLQERKAQRHGRMKALHAWTEDLAE